MRSLIKDSVSPIHNSNVLSQLERNGIRLTTPYLLVAVLQIIGQTAPGAEPQLPSDHAGFNRLCTTACTVCQQMLNVRHRCWAAPADSEILLLVNLSGISDPNDPTQYRQAVSDTADTLRQAVDYLQRDYSILLVGSVSRVADDLSRLTHLWTEAQALFEQNEAFDSQRVITPYDISETENPDRYRRYNERLFYNSILAGDIAQARALTQDYAASFPSGADSVWALRAALKSRLHTAVALLAARNENGRFPVTPEIDTALARCRTLEQLIAVPNLFFDCLEPKNAGSGRTGKVLQYIREHYPDCDLSVDGLAIHFGYTPSYLSHLFRTEQGESLVNCITRLRVDQAKELLTSSPDHLNRIAQQVGYLSAWTLTRAFRRLEGLTPAQYRALHNGS